jgi:hypothetical protein
MAEAEYIAMTRQAQDSLIAIAVLWVICAAVVGFRLMGRVQGAGIGPDDVLSCVALVCLYSTTMLTKTMEVDR